MVLADLYQADGNAAAAVEQYERVNADRSRLSPDQLKSLLQSMGSAYLQLSPSAADKARKTYEELLPLMPNDMLLLNNLAYVNITPGSGGTAADALKYSQQAYELSLKRPQDEQALYVWDTYGWVLVQNNRREEGLDVLRRTAAMARFPDVHLHLAEALLMAGDIDGADLALSGAKRAIETIERDKRPLDSTLRPKLDQLTADVAAKRKNAVGLAK
jgi:Flp pilus assembly protein TadD